MNNKKFYENVFEALEDDPLVAENLRVRAVMMKQLRQYIKNTSMTQKEAAKLMGVNQPRISNLVKGKIDRFTIDMLITMLARIGTHVNFSFKKAA